MYIFFESCGLLTFRNKSVMLLIVDMSGVICYLTLVLTTLLQWSYRLIMI
jgi:hypothetical protein